MLGTILMVFVLRSWRKPRCKARWKSTAGSSWVKRLDNLCITKKCCLESVLSDMPDVLCRTTGSSLKLEDS